MFPEILSSFTVFENPGIFSRLVHAHVYKHLAYVHVYNNNTTYVFLRAVLHVLYYIVIIIIIIVVLPSPPIENCIHTRPFCPHGARNRFAYAQFAHQNTTPPAEGWFVRRPLFVRGCGTVLIRIRPRDNASRICFLHTRDVATFCTYVWF